MRFLAYLSDYIKLSHFSHPWSSVNFRVSELRLFTSEAQNYNFSR
jgi:hypothetical protein